MERTRLKNLVFRLPPNLKEGLERLAKRTRVRQSEWVREALADLLEKHAAEMDPDEPKVKRIAVAQGRHKVSRAACICRGHAHRGGKGGCYFGGTLVPACPCLANLEP